MKTRPDAKRQLLDAAQRLFVEKGFQAVSTRDIAEAAKVNLGSIQYHFGSKAKLFMEAVYSLMEDAGCAKTQLPLEGELRSPAEAAQKLGEFVEHLLRYLLLHKGVLPCRLMHREVLSSSEENSEIVEAIATSYVQDFIAPVDDLLIGLIAVLAPTADRRARELLSQSIVGQCTFYVTHGPFLEKLRGRSLQNESLVVEIARHITRFSLKGIGCPEDMLAEFAEKCPKSSASSQPNL